VVLTSAFNLAANLAVVFVFVLAAGVAPTWTWLLLPLLLAVLFAFTAAVATLLSALYPRFRDTAIIWSVTATALFYATPVLYPVDIVPAPLRHVLALNPLFPIFELARKWVIDPTAPGPVAATGGGPLLLVPATLFIAVFVLAAWIFKREAPRIAEEL
jgi:ABC-2 type transport system permease protein